MRILTESKIASLPSLKTLIQTAINTVQQLPNMDEALLTLYKQFQRLYVF